MDIEILIIIITVLITILIITSFLLYMQIDILRQRLAYFELVIECIKQELNQN